MESFFSQEDDITRSLEGKVNLFVTDVPWGVIFKRGGGGIINSDIVTEDDIRAICAGVKYYLHENGKSRLTAPISSRL